MTELNYRKDNKNQVPYEHYLEEYKKADPAEISERLKVPFDEEGQYFRVKMLDTVYHVSWPEYEISHEDNAHGVYPLETMMDAKTLMLRYLLEGKDVPGSGEFSTFRELPWGNVYETQFHGRCILRLAYGFANKQERFAQILETLGGTKLRFADMSYEVEIFKGYFVRFLLWEGDDEFAPSSQILFSNNFAEGFHPEDRVVTGDVCIGTFKALDKVLAK